MPGQAAAANRAFRDEGEHHINFMPPRPDWFVPGDKLTLSFEEIDAMFGTWPDWWPRREMILRSPDFDKSAISASDMLAHDASLHDISVVFSRAASWGRWEAGRRLRMFMADTSARVVPIFEAAVPGDFRLREAIETARAYAAGRASDEQRLIAKRAAQQAAQADAGQAARRAALSCGHCLTGPGVLKFALDITAEDARRAVADDGDPDMDEYEAKRDAEEAWQRERLVAWLSDPEPTPLNPSDARAPATMAAGALNMARG